VGSWGVGMLRNTNQPAGLVCALPELLVELVEMYVSYDRGIISFRWMRGQQITHRISNISSIVKSQFLLQTNPLFCTDEHDTVLFQNIDLPTKSFSTGSF
jgi:hypothetical protein